MLTFLGSENLPARNETSADAVAFQVIVAQFLVIQTLVASCEGSNSFPKVLDGIEVLASVSNLRMMT